MNDVTGTPPGASLRLGWNELADRLGAWIGHDLIGLAARLALAAVFWLSGRTKVDGLLTVNDTAHTLFREDYRVPLLPPEVGAHIATYAEHLLPVLLVAGLATRLSALGLLGMTAVIQIFVYPQAWPTHLTWAVPMLYLIGRGGGRWSIDAAIGVR